MCLFGKGTQGTQGKNGVQGTIGAQGMQGYMGAQGAQGIAGSGVTQDYVDSSFQIRDNLISAINASLNNTVNGNTFFYSIADVPLTSTSPGIVNSIAYDINYLYVCIETDKWLRTSLNTW
jgi:hypothetical protein